MKSSLRRFPRPAAAFATLMFAASLASAPGQEAPAAPSAASADDKVRLNAFEVSGTRVDGLINKPIFRSDEEAPLPYNVIDRSEIDRLGATSMEELFRNVPEATNYGNVLQNAVGNATVSGGQTYSTAAINLRGFGVTQTVVLINGRLLGPGTNVGGPDISRIPLGSIERIEILPAAAAAIYGGGAIGGAVNIILRKEYAGRDITTYFGTSSRGGGTEFRVTLLEGRTWNGGRTKLTTTADYNTREPVYLGQRDYLRRVLEKYGPDTPYRNTNGTSVFETVTMRAYAGMPGMILTSNATGGLGIPGNTAARYATIPAGLNPTQAMALTPDAFSGTAGKVNLKPRYDRSVLYRPQDNYSVQLQFEHAFVPERLSLYVETNAAAQRQNYSFPQYNVLSLTATHPMNPFRTGVTPGFVGIPITILLDTPDIRDPSSMQERNDARFTAGLKGKVGDRWEWTFDVSSQYQRLYSEGYNPQNYLSSLLSSTSAVSTYAARWSVWNPFVDHGAYPISADTESKYFYYRRDNAFYNWNVQSALRLVGDILQLPAGPWRLSPGAELRTDERRGMQFVPASQAMLDLIGSSQYVGYFSPTSETIRAQYVQTTVPVMSRKWSLAGIEAAEIGASRRWQQSNRSRATITNSISGSISVIRDVLLRASLTEGFNPLTTANIAAPTVYSDYLVTITDPRRGNAATPTRIPTYQTGGNPLLRTEFARSKSFGLVLRPRFVKGFSLTVNYFETKRFDTVSTPSIVDVLNFPQDYPGRLERAALSAADQAAGYTAGAITRLNLTYINLALLTQSGFDYRANYRLPLPPERFGTVTWNLTLTNYNQYKQKAKPGSAAISYVDIQNYVLRFRGNSAVFWEKGPWLAGLTARYTNPYYASTTEPTPALPTASGIDGRKIPASTIFDVQLGYKVPAGAQGGRGWRRWLGATEWRLGILNVLDREPPMYSDGTGFYSRYEDPRQRFIYGQVKKSL